MGVPKFFRYISERYPCLSELVKEYEIPDFDNMYLDMNGIIHMCSHPNDFDPHFRISEERIFEDIFHYLECLFRLIRPRKLFFMAVDGVAPRAKMNQQRGRRFRSAKEAEILEKRARDKGEKLPSEARFDSNCITPGTVFMARLHEQLKYFVARKISTDKTWKGVKVILSGHETPGEGEHKIMEYIRWMKTQPDYDVNTRHCLYGLDADLMMLGLCTHEPHFSLLREEVKFGKQAKRSSTPEETRFYLLHLSLMREYLDLEFQALKTKLPFPYDLESIIDDWVLMGFLVGNDFIPHLPDVHISSGALPMLYNAYIEVLPTLEGYINEHGTLRLERFQKFMEKLAAFDVNQFKDSYADLKYFEGKTGRKLGSKQRHSYKNGGGEELSQKAHNSELDALIKATDDMFLEDKIGFDFDENDIDEEDDDEDDADVFGKRTYEGESDSEEATLFKMEFHQHKKHYYKSKLEYRKVTEQVLRDQAEGYVRAIQWNLHYYYHGCASWSWYYPHHYAPYVSDICNFKDVKLEFDLGKPFLPFEQLLAVLPAASKSLLPVAYQELMVEADSPIIEYYPVDFRTDLNGKKQEWEAVVLIPFIAEDRLLTAMQPCQDRLSDDEKKRNSYGPMLAFTHTEEDLGEYEAPEFFPKIKCNNALLTPIWRKELQLAHEDIVHGLLPGVRLDVYFPGFPTFKHLAFSGALTKAKVHVFDQASRGENMVLTLKERDDIKSLSLNEAANEYLGKDVYCSWPHLIEARVVAVSDGKKRHNLLPSGKVQVEDLQEMLSAQFAGTKNGISERYMSKQGIKIGPTDILLYACHVEGRKYTFGSTGKITLSKIYAKIPTPYAVQTVVKDIAVHDPSFVQYRTLEEVFPTGSTCFMLAPPHYGAMGQVMEGGSNTHAGRVKVNMTVVEEPNTDNVMYNQHLFCEPYMVGGKAAQRIGISPHILSRITGTIFIVTGNKQAENPSKLNAGLNLKFNKKNEEVPGYTRKENNTWLYSMKTVELVREYSKMFPEVFEHINCHSSNDVYDDRDIFPGDDCAEKIKALTKWLKEVPSASVDRRTCGSEVLDNGVIRELKSVVDKFFAGQWKVKHVVMQVKPHILYKSELRVGNLAPDPTTTYYLFDRVVNVKENSAMPLGLKGTITGIHQADKEADIMYDVLFDRPFPGGMDLGGGAHQSYRVSRTGIINLTYGLRKDGTRNNTKSMTSSKQTGSPLSAGSRQNSAFVSWNPPQGSNNWRTQGRQDDAAPQGFKFPAPPIVSPKHRQNPVTEKSSNELRLWNELQMMSGKNQGRKVPYDPPPASSLPTPKGHSKDGSKKHQPQSVQPVQIAKKMAASVDGTDMLKKILRISVEDAEQVSLRPQPVVKQLSVDAIMQAAAASGISSEAKSHPKVEEASAGGLLLDFYQRKGLGVPLFSYVTAPDGKTRAELTLPERRTVQGDWTSNKFMAAESAAGKALKLLSSSTEHSKPVQQAQAHNSGPPQQSVGQPHQFFQQFKIGQFPPPPRPPFSNVGYENPRWQQPVSSWMGPPPVAPFSQAPPNMPGFQPQNHPLQQQQRKYHDQNGSNWRSQQGHPGHSQTQTQQGHPGHSQTQTQQGHPGHSQTPRLSSQQQRQHSNWQQSQRQPYHPQGPPQQPVPPKVHHEKELLQTKSQDSNPFVPLQAVKQQRTVAKSAALLRNRYQQAEHQAVRNKDTHLQSQSAHAASVQKEEQSQTKPNVSSPPKQQETEKGGSTSFQANMQASYDHRDHEKTEAPRPISRVRKSRLAINFNVPTNQQ